MSKLKWTIPDLQRHLQGVVDLELWTIPYYLTVLYSIKDPTSEAYKLVQSALYQEMLHTQLAANICNAWGLRPKFTVPDYTTGSVPHIEFDLDDPDPTTVYTPYSAHLGPLDLERINTMCLVEYPEWNTERTPDLRRANSEYGSIGEFYDAVRFGLAELREHCRGGVNQVSEFKHFYNGFAQPTISRDGEAGYQQAMQLIDVIVDQGEGQSESVINVPVDYQNTADGYKDSWPHFRKFSWIRDAPLPQVWTGTATPARGSAGALAQDVLCADFAAFLDVLERLFAGQHPTQFGSLMAKLGGDVLSCWKSGAIPRFAPLQSSEASS